MSNPPDLSTFQQRLIKIIATADGKPSGREIQRKYQSEHPGEAPLSGRLYPNLSKLVGRGLIKKDERNGRTNEYELSPDGVDAVHEYADSWENARSAAASSTDS